jgi:adenosine kinase
MNFLTRPFRHLFVSSTTQLITQRTMASASTPSVILGVGNPLLDLSVHNEDLLKKYDLRLNNVIPAEEKHMPIYEEIAAMPGFEYIAGGSTLNTIRVAQWVSQTEHSTAYMGSVGDDDFGKRLIESAKSQGVDPAFYLDKEHPTGTCAVVIHEKERSLVFNLGAANHFKEEHLDAEASKAIVDKAKIIYSAGFFLTVSPQSAVRLGKFCAENNRIFATNLSAEFISQFFGEQLAASIEYAGFVFGNETEAKVYAEQNKLEDQSPEGIARYIANLPYKGVGKRVAVITQGAEATVVATAGGDVQSFPVTKIETSKIVDLNGAGDAFVGGFLAALAKDAPIAECVQKGQKAAEYIIQRSGTTVEGSPDF